MNIIRLSSISEFEKWKNKINTFLISKGTFINQNILFWEKVLNNLNKHQYEILIAFDNGKVVDCISYVIFHGKYGRVIVSNPLIGYGGFLNDNGDTWEKIIEELVIIAKQNSCLTLTISTPPYQENLIEQYLNKYKADYIYKNFYQYSLINDGHPLNQLEKKKRDKIKNSINKASKYGDLIVRVLTSLEEWKAWIKIYKKRYEEIGALEYSSEFFLNIFKYSSTNKFENAKLYGLFSNSTLIGGILIVFSYSSAEYFSSAFLSSENHVNGTTFTLNYIFNELDEKKIVKFNWQSSPGKSGVYNYKKSWGALEGEHIYLVKVIGDLNNLINTPLNLIKEEYKGMYILPYDLWKENVN